MIIMAQLLKYVIHTEINKFTTAFSLKQAPDKAKTG